MFLSFSCREYFGLLFSRVVHLLFGSVVCVFVLHFGDILWSAVQYFLFIVQWSTSLRWSWRTSGACRCLAARCGARRTVLCSITSLGRGRAVLTTKTTMTVRRTAKNPSQHTYTEEKQRKLTKVNTKKTRSNNMFCQPAG